ncbi:MAG: hypothetical protein L0177_07755 [Chloroflexi bacterium]|nr:hypothetical protein [Chloroflexota bacterium]
MKKQKRDSTKTSAPERLTLYVKPEHQALLNWVQDYARAKSLSEAVFSVLAEFKALVKERQMQALRETHGIWKDDPLIDDALKELEEGWEKWRRQVEEY